MENVLILGGSSFIGRNLVERMIKEGKHKITLLNRGQTNPNLFSNVDHIVADRNIDDIAHHINQNWTTIIDLSCYFPKSLEHICNALPASLNKYIFISTCSVYDHETQQTELRSETAPILGCTPQQAHSTDVSTYGNRKAECERILEHSGSNYSIFRPALVYGQYDPTDRFYYWLHQIMMHKTVMLPDKGARRFSTTYAHDLVQAILLALETPHGPDTFNLTTTPETSLALILSHTNKILRKAPNVINMSPEFLHKQQVSQWSDLPLWLDTDAYTYTNNRAIEVLGFEPTAVDQSIAETITYFDSMGWPDPGFGMTESRKKELIELHSAQRN